MKNGHLLKEWAEKLNGRQYGSELTNEECRELARQNIVAIYGASDDLVEIVGAFDEEMGAYNGTDFHISRHEMSEEYFAHEDLHDCPVLSFEVCKVEAIWAPDDCPTASWKIVTNSPNSVPFDIFEDGKVFCHGILIAL